MNSKRAITIALLGGIVVGLAGSFVAGNPLAFAATQSSKSCPWPANMDAVAAAPKNHRVLLDNEQVRVLDVSVAPGEREPTHAHCLPSVLIAIQDGRARDYDAKGQLTDDGTIIPNGSTAPFAFWLDRSPPHSVENVDSIPVH